MYSISKCCKYLRVPRATYYYHLNHPKIARYDEIEARVVRIFMASKEVYGSRKIKMQLFKEDGSIVSRRKIRSIMKANFLISVYTEAIYKNYSRKDKVNRDEIDNNLHRQFDKRNKHEVLVSDLTYVKVNDKWHYICFLTDLFNREIISYSVGPNKTAGLVLNAFMNTNIPLTQIKCFHTDRGSEFKNEAIDRLLSAYGIKRSLSNPGVPYDNAVSESLYHISKTEFIRERRFPNLETLKTELFEYVWWYNHHRLHSTLGYMSPVEYRLNYVEKGV